MKFAHYQPNNLTMKKYKFFIIGFSLILTSCEQYDIPCDYPTTYKKLTTNILAQRLNSFTNRNQYISSQLNEFGFCGFSDNNEDIFRGIPPYKGPLNKIEAIEIVDNFIANSQIETGIVEPLSITFSQESTSTGFDGAVLWVFKTNNQKIDTIEILNSMIIFHITNNEVTWCVGNWYPVINVPKEFNISPTKAKSILNNKEVSHYTIAGDEYKVTISNIDLDQSSVNLKVLPKVTEDKIELRVCWQINIPGPVYYKMYVDVMTGEIIGRIPTIIS